MPDPSRTQRRWWERAQGPGPTFLPSATKERTTLPSRVLGTPPVCHPLKPAMWEWKTQIPAQSWASTISGPRPLPKASLDLAACSITWERLSHTPLFQKGNPRQNMTAEHQGRSLSGPLPPQRGPWIAKEESKNPRKWDPLPRDKKALGYSLPRSLTH